MKDFRINGRLTRVFVLKEAKDRLVYISLKNIIRVDYDVLVGIEAAAARSKVDMLDYMTDYKLPNGMNALVVYDKVIQVMNKEDGSRLRKPDEVNLREKGDTQSQSKNTDTTSEVNQEKESEPEVERRRGPGRPRVVKDEA